MSDLHLLQLEIPIGSIGGFEILIAFYFGDEVSSKPKVTVFLFLTL